MRASEAAQRQTPFQFATRDLLAWTWCVGAAAAALRGGASSLLAFGIPLGLVGYHAIARQTDWRLPPWRFAARCWPVAGCGGLLAMALAGGLRPLDAASAMSLVGVLLWSVILAAAKRPLWRILAPACMAPPACLLLCLGQPQLVDRLARGVSGTVALQDVRGGRQGVRILYDFRFGWSGPNAALIERYLGRVAPEWEGAWYLSRYYSGWDERVNRRSIIRRAELPQMLAMLPSSQSRQQVLACLASPSNLARVHQGLLLECLRVYGYPPGYDAESWWRRHRALFRIVENGQEASLLVWGWRPKVEQLAMATRDSMTPADSQAIFLQLDAALNQELGMWGGDSDFSEVYYALGVTVQASLEGNSPEESPRLGVDEIAWWPHDAPSFSGVRPK